MGAKLPEHLGGVHQATFRHVDVRRSERGVQGSPVGVVQPVTWIEREQLDLGALWKGGWLVEYEAAAVDSGFDGHEGRLASD